ncbi:MAG: hypothetical protein ACOZJZ_04390, partial [Pseudomonadota bacterium]
AVLLGIVLLSLLAVLALVSVDALVSAPRLAHPIPAAAAAVTAATRARRRVSWLMENSFC